MGKWWIFILLLRIAFILSMKFFDKGAPLILPVLSNFIISEYIKVKKHEIGSFSSSK